ncbi:MAG TPA: phosphomannomutase/phosphoglucomutase [Candidatus Nanoarchaeia archaeon]|nr:phosphomannomutase/phosphoglucomutase [Candidatus Nanoarchaeia archaeon]
MKEVPFKANDIRGLYPKEVNEKLFYNVGKAIPCIISSNKIAIGMDIRLSSKSLFNSLSKGLMELGVSVLDLGYCDTPYTYFISGKYKIPVCMITASHNPKQYNGLKIVNKGCIPLSEEQISHLLEVLDKEEYGKSKNKGKIKKFNKQKEYAHFLLSQIKGKELSKMKVVVDCSNGMASFVVPLVLSKIPIEVIYINKKPDGNFPAHVPNPAIPSNMKQLQQAVLEEKADLGIIYDGDCDRVAFVDNKGSIVSSSTVASILAHYYLDKSPGSKVVHTVNMSINLQESIRTYSGVPIMAQIGQRMMKAAMIKNKAILGAEYSGHYYFKDFWYADSGILASLIFYSILSELKTPLSLISKNFSKYHSTGEINYSVKDRERSFTNVRRYFKALNPVQEILLDGYAAVLKDGYVTLRKSNTENVIRVTLESKNLHFLQSIKRDIDRII